VGVNTEDVGTSDMDGLDDLMLLEFQGWCLLETIPVTALRTVRKKAAQKTNLVPTNMESQYWYRIRTWGNID
jgi:hypothetical protein